MTRSIARTVLPLLLIALIAGPTTGAEAAGKKRFRQIHVCASSMGEAVEPTTSYLEVSGHAGHMTDETGETVGLCYGEYGHEFAENWHPTVRRFKLTIRWYAGTRLIKKSSTTRPRNGDPSKVFKLSGAGLSHASESCVWTKNGQRISVRITFSKKGYRTKTITRKSFCGYY